MKSINSSYNQFHTKNFILAIFILAGLILVVSFAFTGCGKKDTTPCKETDFYFDTAVSITVYGLDNKRYLSDCMDICNKYDKLLDRHNEESDIYKINHASDNIPAAVDDDVLEVIKQGLYYCNLSGGAFNITLGRLIDAWGINTEHPSVPDSSIIDCYSGTSSLDLVSVHDEEHSVSCRDAELDLGGIAKGFVADKLKEYLQQQNISSGIINLGCNILLIGSKPDGSDYRIGIRQPFGAADEYIATVKASDVSIVTSGIYERFFYEDNQLYHHILDPQTGYPADNNLLSVTIISSSSTAGDALSTACFVMGEEKALKLLDSLKDVYGVFVTKDGEVHLSTGLTMNSANVITIEELYQSTNHSKVE